MYNNILSLSLLENINLLENDMVSFRLHLKRVKFIIQSSLLYVSYNHEAFDIYNCGVFCL